MKRVVIYGDIHGCLDELKSLRKKIDIESDDIEISVGDILNKGPYLASEMIHYFELHNIEVIMGNNEAKALKLYKKYMKVGEEFLKTLRPFEIATVLSMQEDDFIYLSKLSYYKRVKNLTILHGGLTPAINLNKLDDNLKKEITLIRYLNKDLEPIPWSDTENRYKFWSEIYDGREGFVVSGHHPFPEPKVDKYAIDIDTGCVYGGMLTAAVFQMNKKSVDTKNYELISVKAKKDYWKEYLRGRVDENN